MNIHKKGIKGMYKNANANAFVHGHTTSHRIPIETQHIISSD